MKKINNLFFIILFSLFSVPGYAEKIFDIVVAKDGSGDYATLTEAVNKASDSGTTIFIKNGTYREKLDITKKNITLIGQNAEGVVFVWNGSGAADGTANSYTIRAKGENFYAENITFWNDFGNGSQAVALSVQADKAAFKNCRFLGYQDTHYIHSSSARQYYKNCFIEGATDFIFGGAIAVFDDCQINCVKGGSYITAPATNTYDYGMVFRDCVITANSDVPANSYYLGRPWKDNGKTVWLNCKMGNHIKSEGWARWRDDPNHEDYDNAETGFYAEYKSMDLTGNLLNVSSRASWGKQLTDDEAAKYTPENIYGNKRTPTWDPLPLITTPDRVEDLSMESNQITWTAIEGAKGYAVVRNGKVIGFCSTPSYTDETAIDGVGYTYYIYTVNNKGNLSKKSNAVIVNGGGDETGEDPFPGYEDGDILIDEDFASQKWIDYQSDDALDSSVFIPTTILGVYRETEITQNSKILPARAKPEGASKASDGAVYLEKSARVSYFILPELPSCKNITAVWCYPGDKTARNLILEKNVYGTWVEVKGIESELTSNEGSFSYNMEEPGPIQFRLYNASGDGAIYLHDLKITAYKEVTESINSSKENQVKYLQSNAVKDVIVLNNAENLSDIYIYSLSGTLMKSVKASDIIDVSNLNKGYYIIKMTTKNGSSVQEKIVKY